MTTRREFLKLLGIGAVAAGSPMGFEVFSTGAAPLIGGGSHFIATGPIKLKEEARAYHLHTYTTPDGEPCVGYLSSRSTPDRRSRRGTDAGWFPQGLAEHYEIAEVRGVAEDPHVTYYIAAMRLRDTINQKLLAFQKTLGVKGLVMITYVHSPIRAYPQVNRGYGIATELSHFAAFKDDIMDFDKVVSSTGEVPIETPSNVEFTLLLRMAEELVSMGFVKENPMDKVRMAHRRVRVAMESMT